MANTRTNEVRISDGVVLLKPERPEPARVYLVIRRGEIEILACVQRGIAGASTQRQGESR